MPDLGRTIQFGVFLTPSADDPHAVVERARASEAAGFDLVTFQDHPYNSRFLDTWTLMSWVAASTSRVTIAPNVLNLPLRPPAVLARAAASLDLLSGGRFELGLGSGAFWDGIAAMTGQRLTSKEAVDALEEAIPIIRALWDAQDRSGVRVEGTHYRLQGARRGPAPAHRIGIWLGAYKPRMLRLTGTLADGWLPSLPYLQPGDLASGNARITEAALAAGRQPSDIRRMLNVPRPEGALDRWTDELTGMALDDGIDTFMVMGDDTTFLERVAQEVVPRVRELVAKARDVVPSVPATRPPELAASPASTTLDIRPTPDDGTRLSARMRWDERTRPVAPTPPPDASYTDQGRRAGQHLIDVHDHLRTELAQVRAIVTQVKAGTRDAADARGDIAAMTLRQNDWIMGAYCASYCRIVTTHHTIEDESVFPYLARTEIGLRPVIERLEAEHRVIHAVLDEVDAALVAWIEGPPDAAGLDAAIDSLTDTLLSHLSYEERELVEPLARHGFYPGQL